MNRGWSEHNFSNFVDVDEKFVEISVHATKKEQGTQKLQHERLDHNNVSCGQQSQLGVVGSQHHVERQSAAEDSSLSCIQHS